eukprot:11282016-Alexandrium_andersonii.AAC.1
MFVGGFGICASKGAERTHREFRRSSLRTVIGPHVKLRLPGAMLNCLHCGLRIEADCISSGS